MKKYVAVLFVFLQIGVQAMAQPTGYGIHYSPQELAVWRQRATTGPYKSFGDAATNTPGDYDRIVQYANQFKAAPYEAGNDSRENLTLWTGYPVTNGVGEFMPVWQGIKAMDAAFYYLMTGDTSYGNQVKRTMLRQVALGGQTNLDNWASNTPYEYGFTEAIWLTRMVYSYDYTKELWSASEKTTIINYLTGCANYYKDQIQAGPAGQCFPQRLLNNYTVVGRDALPQGIVSYPSPIYAEAATRNQWGDNNGAVYTHRNADGTLGNKIARLAYHYNNRASDKMEFVGMLGICTNNADLILHAKRWCTEWLKYSVYPDGTLGEYERCGDWNNPAQGFFYGFKNINLYVVMADALARKGDMSLFAYSTSEGIHGTQGGPKTIMTPLMRVVNNATNNTPIFYKDLSPNNRIDIQNETGNVHNPFDIIMAIANKYFNSATLKDCYMRRAPGAIPYTANRLATSAKVGMPWGGPGATLPGILFMNGQLENLNVYQVTCPVPAGLGVASITASGATASWTSVGLAGSYKVRYRVVGGSTWTEVANADRDITLTGLAANTTYEVQVMTNCQAGNGSAYSASQTFMTLPAACPAPTAASASNVTFGSAQLNATAAAGALSYKIEYRLVGASNYTSVSAASLPYVLNGLAADSPYEARIQSNCGPNYSAFTSLIIFRTAAVPCPLPTSMGVSNITDQQADIDGVASLGADYYTIEFRIVGSGSFTSSIATSLPYTMIGLLASTDYEVRVQTTCAFGSSAFSALLPFRTGAASCISPTGLAGGAIAGQDTARIVWAPANGASSYQLRLRVATSANWKFVIANTTSHSEGDLLDGVRYQFQVASTCPSGGSGYGPSSEFVMPVRPCPSASNLLVANIGQTGATARWSVNADRTVNNTLRYRLVGATAWTEVTTDDSSMALAGLSAGSRYELQVKAICYASDAGFGGSTFFTTGQPPCAVPSALAASSITNDGATIRWVAGSGSNVANTELSYRTAGGSWTTQLLPTNTIALSGLASSTTYEVRARTSCNGGAFSAYTATITFATTAPAVCNAPAVPSIGAIGSSRATATWTAMAGVSAYKVRVRLQGNASWAVADAGTPSYTIVGLAAGGNYEVQVQSVCSATAVSSWSSSATFRTLAPTCGVPTTAVARAISTDSVLLTITMTGTYTAFVYTFHEIGGSGLLTDTIRSLTARIGGFSPGASYYVSAKSLCALGESNFSFQTNVSLPQGCNAMGTVRKETWAGAMRAANGPAPTVAPSAVRNLSNLEETTTVSSRPFAARVKGILCPPATGAYTFFINGVGSGELFLSTTRDSSRKQKIASYAGSTGYRVYTAQASQKSVVINLVVGQQYYLEALYSDTGRTDYMGVAWLTPSVSAPVVIAGSRFTSSAPRATTTEVQEATVAPRAFASLYPNPSAMGSSITLKGLPTRATIRIASADGKELSQLVANAPQMELDTQSLAKGLYIIRIASENHSEQILRMVRN